ncbi:glutathione s-transferase [Moniliophthora roreri MCA 2997]|uniref:Glutathione s-transferase n=1 Tax=Moniliophthora roreri (strain MCA 2997) TaxID=1381753 RepID=V2XHV8_MONRO|nr:glutathione s-transferase [Moniliophthora roreri MCA 2997]
MSDTDVRAQPIATDGSYQRVASVFRNTIEKRGKFEPEGNRYHLYVSMICPWAARTLIVRKLKGLQDIIPVTIASPRMTSSGWPFAIVDNFPGTEEDPLYGSSYIMDLYRKADPNYSGRFTVPVLWDKKTQTIVNNESSEIIRIFNSAFNELLPEKYAKVDLYPEELRGDIDELNEWVYTDINNGVYRSGFATTQQAYETAVKTLFAALDRVEGRLHGKDYLVGGKLTEADVRLWATMIRFDPAYHGDFKCNIKDIRHGYPEINRWMKNLYWNGDEDAFKSSTNFDHIKSGYYSLNWVNPNGIVPVGPIPDIEPL